MRHHGRMPVPAERPYRVTFVCSGNICRSPMAEVVFASMVVDAGLGDRVVVDSAGTGDWHVGERADDRALTALAVRGYDGSSHRARQFDAGDFATTDLVVALDAGHAKALRSWASTKTHADKVVLLRSFDSGLPASAADHLLDIADPYYGGSEGFDEVFEQVHAGGLGLLERVKADLAR